MFGEVSRWLPCRCCGLLGILSVKHGRLKLETVKAERQDDDNKAPQQETLKTSGTIQLMGVFGRENTPSSIHGLNSMKYRCTAIK